MVTRMTKRQKTILVVLAILNLAVLVGLGFTVYRTMTNLPEPLPLVRLPTPTNTPPSTPTPAPTPTLAYAPTFASADCLFRVPAGATVECGFVSVPEDRDGDLADTIRLSVAVYRSSSDSPAPDPVVYLHGGPGGRALGPLASRYEEFIVPLLKERDLVVFDQRGAGLSEPRLDCSELKLLYLDDLQHKLPADEREIRYTNALTTCHDRLVSDGANLAAYTSAASAADVRDVVTVLNYEQVNLYGVSYGTRLAQTVMRDFPEIVRSAVLDSVLPVEVNPYAESAATRTYVLSALFDACAADLACSAAYPELKTVFYDLVARLDAEPITVRVPNPLGGQSYDAIVNGAGLTSAVMWGLHSSSTIPLVPQAIYDVHAGDYSRLGYALALPAMIYEDTSLGVMISINCHEQIFTSTPEELEAGLAGYHLTEAVGLSSIYESGESLFSLCRMWDAAPFDPRETEPLVSDIPTLIFAGEYDPTTPSAFGRQLADNLGQARLVEFPGEGHAPSPDGAGGCPLSLALAFLDDPTAGLDKSCVSELDEPRFVVPFTSTAAVRFKRFTDEEYGITGIVPRDWKAIGSGFYNRAASALDPTQLGIQSAHVTTAVWLHWLAKQYRYIGFDDGQVPQFVGERQANGLTWGLHAAEFEGNPVDLALAEADGLTLLVVLLSVRSEHDAVYEALFLPVVDATLPAERDSLGI
jgi:pimeloyl-ACP methyl ester carboxylesterase